MALAGIFLGALAGAFYTTSRMFMRMTYQSELRPMPELEVNFVIHAVCVILFVPAMCRNKKLLQVPRHLRWSMFWITVGANAYGTFVALSLSVAPVGDVTSIAMAGNVLTAFLGYICLKDPLSWIDCVSGVVGFTGVLILARPTFLFGPEATTTDGKIGSPTALSPLAIMYCALTALSVPVFAVAIRKWILDGGYNLAAVILPYFIGLPISFLTMFPDYSRLRLSVTWLEVAYLLAASVTWTLGLTTHVYALESVDAFVVGIARNMDIVLAFLLQYFIMHELVTIWKISGSALIVLSFLILVLKRVSFIDIFVALRCRKCACNEDNNVDKTTSQLLLKVEP